MKGKKRFYRNQFYGLFLIIFAGSRDGGEVAHEASRCTREMVAREASASSDEQILWEILEGEKYTPLHYL